MRLLILQAAGPIPIFRRGSGGFAFTLNNAKMSVGINGNLWFITNCLQFALNCGKKSSYRRRGTVGV